MRRLATYFTLGIISTVVLACLYGCQTSRRQESSSFAPSDDPSVVRKWVTDIQLIGKSRQAAAELLTMHGFVVQGDATNRELVACFRDSAGFMVDRVTVVYCQVDDENVVDGVDVRINYIGP